MANSGLPCEPALSSAFHLSQRVSGMASLGYTCDTCSELRAWHCGAKIWTRWCRNTARKWQSWVASPGSLTIILNCLWAIGFGKSEIFTAVMETRLTVLRGWDAAKYNWRLSHVFCEWLCISTRWCRSIVALFLQDLFLGMGQGMPCTKAHCGHLQVAQFVLLHGIPFLTLTHEIRKFELFLYFCTEFVSYSVLQDCICSFHVQWVLQLV